MYGAGTLCPLNPLYLDPSSTFRWDHRSLATGSLGLRGLGKWVNNEDNWG